MNEDCICGADDGDITTPRLAVVCPVHDGVHIEPADMSNAFLESIVADWTEGNLLRDLCREVLRLRAEVAMLKGRYEAGYQNGLRDADVTLSADNRNQP